MKKVIIIIAAMGSLFASAQQLIDNKGNRNQSYPVITQTNPEVVQLINLVEQDSLEARIRYMQGFYRVATSPAAVTVQDWLVSHFESYGYGSDDISIHYFTLNSQPVAAGNVVVVKKGSEFPDEYIMITSHYDHSTFDTPCGPGADDNASGTSGVMECARLLKDFPTKRSIMFVPFNAEEYWMVGSFPFAQKCATENMNIIAHLNMDMIGWFPPSNPNTIMASGYSYISKTLFDYFHQTANTYIPSIPTIRLSDGDSYGGDHMPFNMYEYPSLYIGDIEYHDQHPCYHQPCDTLGNGVNRLDLAKSFVQATLCAAAELANAWLPPQNLSACSGTDHITVTWDSSGESDIYKIYRNNALIDLTTETSYIDNDVEIGKEYEYYVIALSCETRQESAPSYKDKVTFVKPLQLPYSNDFSVNKYGFEQSNWVLRNVNGKSALCNTEGNGYVPDNYLTLAESDWFPIPEDTENITARFKWQGTLNGIWYNTSLFFEVTNDRKTWHKLAAISGNAMGWKNCEFSLNQYIGSDFLQVRFRLESSGAQNYSYTKIGYVTDFEIVFEDGTGIQQPEQTYFKDLVIAPNPTPGRFNINTFQDMPYQIFVYNMQGQIIFQQEHFRDGSLDLSSFPKGAYMIRVAIDGHSIARKIMLQ
ncbi:MAG: M28 family peptidase [Bacteroidales bacterium]|nr:M28 family peptidase [Bacteroidales bacterium]